MCSLSSLTHLYSVMAPPSVHPNLISSAHCLMPCPHPCLTINVFTIFSSPLFPRHLPFIHPSWPSLSCAACSSILFHSRNHLCLCQNPPPALLRLIPLIPHSWGCPDWRQRLRWHLQESLNVLSLWFCPLQDKESRTTPTFFLLLIFDGFMHLIFLGEFLTKRKRADLYKGVSSLQVNTVIS